MTLKKQLRDFGFLLGLGIPLLVGFVLPFIWGHEIRLWTIWIGLSFLIIGILKPSLLFYPYKSWMFIGNFLGWINSHLILGFVYFLVLLPIAIIMRITKYDPLKKKFNDLPSYSEIRKNNNINLKKIF